MARWPWLLAGSVPLLLGGIYLTAWNQAPMRVALQLLLGAAILAMHPRVAPAPALAPEAERAATVSLRVVAAALLALGLALGVEHTVWSARHRTVRLDIGLTTIAAVELLRAGENPYGVGVVLDPATFLMRRDARAALGFPPARADATLRARRLPMPAAPSDAQRREAALYGYKYGPADLLTAAPFVLLLGPAGVPIVDLLSWLALLALLGATLRAHGVRGAAWWAALCIVLADPNMLVSCLRESASDVRALVPLALALWAHVRRRPALVGAAVAVSLAMKLVPALAFVPLLLGLRSWRAAGTFVAVSAALFAPFAIWDGHGLAHNVLQWAFLRDSDPSSWMHDAPAWLVVAGRALLAAAMLLLALRLARGRARAPHRDLALLCLTMILAGSTSHNNYLPWVTWLAAGAFAVAWFSGDRGS